MSNLNIKNLADCANLTLSNESDWEISGLRYAADADLHDIALAKNVTEIKNTRARVVLTEPIVLNTDKILLYCGYGERYPAMEKVAAILYSKENEQLDINAKDGYYIASDAIIGANSHISPFVTIGSGVTIGENTLIEPNVTIGNGSSIGDNCVIHSGARIGADSFLHYLYKGKPRCFHGVGHTVIGKNVSIGYNSVVQRGTLADTVIGDDVLIGNLTVIAHDVRIGGGSRVVCQSGLAGGATLGKNVLILAQSGVVDYVVVGDNSMVMAKSVATKDVPPRKKISGTHGREHRQELKFQARLRQKYGRE
ncbi:DapH/DapD/GlmU-related protein [Mitsuokella jalaludinii]|uniref:DapH/DapD/GlmU-related protein n=1 Tax=Mitsuokella jalaludinii TaxID=187979 RepID=UPI00068A8E01|nr:DapH/DapD/GlmU-related protein [Mitsuokella jalaludinii]